MIKYLYTKITFAEVPDEISLCIDITNCIYHCNNCHSPELRQDIGTPLTIEELNKLIDKNKGITCVCLLGGDGNIRDINNIAQYIHTHKSNLKVCWYSGNTEIPNELNKEYFDYIKYGPYIENLGPLNCKTTNQKFLEKRGDSWIDVTYKFQGVGII